MKIIEQQTNRTVKACKWASTLFPVARCHHLLQKILTSYKSRSLSRQCRCRGRSWRRRWCPSASRKCPRCSRRTCLPQGPFGIGPGGFIFLFCVLRVCVFLECLYFLFFCFWFWIWFCFGVFFGCVLFLGCVTLPYHTPHIRSCRPVLRRSPAHRAHTWCCQMRARCLPFG